jgi:hypothetical protein
MPGTLMPRARPVGLVEHPAMPCRQQGRKRRKVAVANGRRDRHPARYVCRYELNQATPRGRPAPPETASQNAGFRCLPTDVGRSCRMARPAMDSVTLRINPPPEIGRATVLPVGAVDAAADIVEHPGRSGSHRGWPRFSSRNPCGSARKRYDVRVLTGGSWPETGVGAGILPARRGPVGRARESLRLPRVPVAPACG